jgi:3-phenylpropionate/trans-cinnamate dioxygenase ferredoxin reductase subunit
MSTPERIVVVGGGLAAASAVTSLREHGFSGRLVLVSAEPHLPYERPPLSKDYLAGAQQRDAVFVRPRQWYDEHEVELRLGTPARHVDVEDHLVVAADEPIGYDRLLLATGSSPRRIPGFEASGAPLTYLRTLDDSDRIRAALQPGGRILVVGGGWIGLEVAATARTAGCEVTVVEASDVPLGRALGAEIGTVFAALHRSHGVDLRTGTTVNGVGGDADGAEVQLGDGTTVAADLVVVGAGAVPNTALAEAAGLKVDDGVVVDEHLRSSHPDVLAAGDLANAHHPRLGTRVRVEHWDNAIGQGAAAARNLLGEAEAYDRLPYFFTDQYDLGMEYVGHVGPDGYDEVVVRGDPAARVFSAFWVRDARVVAGMHVNDWDAMDHIRRIVGTESTDIAALRDDRVPLPDLAAG